MAREGAKLIIPSLNLKTNLPMHFVREWKCKSTRKWASKYSHFTRNGNVQIDRVANGRVRLGEKITRTTGHLLVSVNNTWLVCSSLSQLAFSSKVCSSVEQSRVHRDRCPLPQAVSVLWPNRRLIWSQYLSNRHWAALIVRYKCFLSLFGDLSQPAGKTLSKMSDVLSRVGLFVDEKKEIRLLEPSVQQKSLHLRQLSDQFIASKCL